MSCNVLSIDYYSGIAMPGNKTRGFISKRQITLSDLKSFLGILYRSFSYNYKYVISEGSAPVDNKAEQLNLDLENNIKILDSFLALKDNWNDYGAEPFSKDHIDFVKIIVEKLNPQPEIFPTAAQSIHLEFDKKNNDVLILDIKKNHSIVLFIKKKKRTIEKVINLEEIFGEVSKFICNEK